MHADFNIGYIVHTITEPFSYDNHQNKICCFFFRINQITIKKYTRKHYQIVIKKMLIKNYIHFVEQ